MTQHCPGNRDDNYQLARVARQQLTNFQKEDKENQETEGIDLRKIRLVLFVSALFAGGRPQPK